MLFKDRIDAAILLARKLIQYKNKKNIILLALPRGGVIIGKELSNILNLPLDIISPKKIPAPFQKELAIGAVCLDEHILNEELISSLNIDLNYIQEAIKLEKKESNRRMQLYRKNLPPLKINNKTIILIDDGIATGATIEVTIKYLKKLHPKKIIIAVPVAPREQIEKLKTQCNEVISLYTPLNFFAIAQFYEDFRQVEDEEVIKIIHGD
ncbi:MAG: hypothetical protein AMS24_03900 [Chlamydiae bacterium SM23_39]|nr:MAG: hypothetical protein AMS24_03900 [Chlamydiae bacterium SM23_39]